MGRWELGPGWQGRGARALAFGRRGRRWWQGALRVASLAALSHAVPRAPPPKVQLHLVLKIYSQYTEVLIVLVLPTDI